MPAVKGAKQTEQDIARLKKEYLDYYKDCPHQKLAAMSIGRDSDTITRWKKEDPDFAVEIIQAEAKFARKEFMRTSSDYKISRLMSEYFKEPEQNVNVKIVPILGGTSALPSDERNQESSQSQEEN